MSFIFAGRPVKCTGTTARVRGVMASSSLCGSIFPSSPMSTKTGFAPASAMDEADAMNEFGAVMTSSPSFEADSAENQMQGAGSIGDPGGELRLTVFSEFTFERRHLWTQYVATAVQHVFNRPHEFGFYQGNFCRQSGVRNGVGRHSQECVSSVVTPAAASAASQISITNAGIG